MALGEIIEPVIPSKWRLAAGVTVAIKIPLVSLTANSEAKREFCDLSSSLNGIPAVVTCDFVIRAPESGGGKSKWLAGHLKQCRDNPAIRLRWLESLWLDAMVKVKGPWLQGAVFWSRRFKSIEAEKRILGQENYFSETTISESVTSKVSGLSAMVISSSLFKVTLTA